MSGRKEPSPRPRRRPPPSAAADTSPAGGWGGGKIKLAVPVHIKRCFAPFERGLHLMGRLSHELHKRSKSLHKRPKELHKRSSGLHERSDDLHKRPNDLHQRSEPRAGGRSRTAVHNLGQQGPAMLAVPLCCLAGYAGDNAAMNAFCIDGN